MVVIWRYTEGILIYKLANYFICIGLTLENQITDEILVDVAKNTDLKYLLVNSCNAKNISEKCGEFDMSCLWTQMTFLSYIPRFLQ